MLNPSKGNMYSFLNDYPDEGSHRGYTWNIIKGRCPHNCDYCFMKRFKQNDIRFDRGEFKTDLGKGNFIFVGSSCDMFADAIPGDWISKVLKFCTDRPNRYLFQTKNPKRMYLDFVEQIPFDAVLGTTIETNRIYRQMGKTLHPVERAEYILCMSAEGWNTMVTIEPIMDFDLSELPGLIRDCNPKWVNIGADSQGCNLPEPSSKKINQLITELEKFTEVKLKDNLKRLICHE